MCDPVLNCVESPALSLSFLTNELFRCNFRPRTSGLFTRENQPKQRVKDNIGWGLGGMNRGHEQRWGMPWELRLLITEHYAGPVFDNRTASTGFVNCEIPISVSSAPVYAHTRNCDSTCKHGQYTPWKVKSYDPAFERADECGHLNISWLYRSRMEQEMNEDRV